MTEQEKARMTDYLLGMRAMINGMLGLLHGSASEPEQDEKSDEPNTYGSKRDAGT